MNSTIDYMEQLISFRKQGIPIPKGWKYSCIEDFVIKNGKNYTEIVPFWEKMKAPKECYKNAYSLSVGNKGLTYVEGYAKPKGLLVTLHAWCITEDEKVIDPTWRNGVEYFGVPFNKKHVNKVLLKRKMYGILDDWEDNFPLLRGVPKSVFIAKI